MQYENLLKSVKEADRNTVKKTIFEIDQQQFDRLKELELELTGQLVEIDQRTIWGEEGVLDELESIFKELRTMLKDRTFLEMLMANALIDEE